MIFNEFKIIKKISHNWVKSQYILAKGGSILNSKEEERSTSGAGIYKY